MVHTENMASEKREKKKIYIETMRIRKMENAERGDENEINEKATMKIKMSPSEHGGSREMEIASKMENI